MRSILNISSTGKGLYEFTSDLRKELAAWPSFDGLLHIFLLHTSASLLIQENADPTAKSDLEEFFDRLAPEHQAWHKHTLEGPDDTTSHLKSALTNSSLTIPVAMGEILIGQWQGIYLFEHREDSHVRKVVLTGIKSS
ncbi:MAG: secondary thiamine-phosphate synthase enzyme YjbQ [Bdellovibrionales bacterium]